MLAIAIALVIVALLVMYTSHGSGRYVCTLSTFDAKKYSVLANETSKEAANMLARINEFVTNLVEYLRVKYVVRGTQERCINAIDIVMRLSNNYSGGALKENFPTDLKYTSYVLNKGDEIAFCLHPRGQPNVFHDFNVVQFVVLHEMAHLATISVGHAQDFWQTFGFLARNATEAGLYVPVDYSKSPVEYCGVHVSYNPVFDKSLMAC